MHVLWEPGRCCDPPDDIHTILDHIKPINSISYKSYRTLSYIIYDDNIPDYWLVITWCDRENGEKRRMKALVAISSMFFL